MPSGSMARRDAIHGIVAWSNTDNMRAPKSSTARAQAERVLVCDCIAVSVRLLRSPPRHTAHCSSSDRRPHERDVNTDSVLLFAISFQYL